MNELKRDYVRYLKLQRGMTANTIDAYGRDVDKLLAFLQGEGLRPEDTQLADLQHFAAGLHDIGIGPRSQCRILSGVRSFFRFMAIDGRIEQDPSELLESPVLGQHLPEYLTPQEVDMLEDSIDLSVAEGQRNRAIIEVLFSCGLRVSELVQLRLSNLFEEEQFVRIMGKGNKERLVPISPRALHELQLWFIDRNQLKIKPGEEDYVFLNRRGHHLTRTMIRHSEDHLAPHAAPLVCHGTARGWGRPARDSGPAGPREHWHHRNIYARDQPVAAADSAATPPAQPALSGHTQHSGQLKKQGIDVFHS